jgi:choline dehydrogenase-like flavoprotein
MKFISAEKAAAEAWDVVTVGSGMGSLFFLKKFLEAKPDQRVLIVEKGGYNTHQWQLDHLQNAPVDNHSTYRNIGEFHKEWAYTIGLGGSSNCWWALTPRLHPDDFRIHTLTGTSVDWPVGYDDLVPYYQQAENIMLIAGSDELEAHYPGTAPYPQPAHHLTTVDGLMRQQADHLHYPMPTAKLSRATDASRRNRCCSTSRCHLCPVDAKFNALNGFEDVLSHPSVSICLESEVQMLDTADGVVKSVQFRNGTRDYKASCDLCVLGANALWSPFIMLRSGIGGHGVGRYLGEKMLANVEVYLDGLQHYDGGTATTTMNLSLLKEGRTKDRGTTFLIFKNGFDHGLRLDPPGRWRECLPLGLYVEDHMQYENGVFDDGGDTPAVKFGHWSEYAQNTLAHAMSRLPDILKPLPVEEIREPKIWPTLGHVQGTCRMGTGIENSVVDDHLVSHAVRNLVVVGTSVFPTSGSVNPTLTAAALSLRSAEHLTG